MVLTLEATASMSADFDLRAVFSSYVHVTDVDVLAIAVATTRILAISLLAEAAVSSSILLVNSAHVVGTSEAALASRLELVKEVSKTFASAIFVLAAFPLAIVDLAAASS